MQVPLNREIDAWIAEHVMKLEGVGYYRRESCRSGGWEKCNKGDHTKDEPNWKADLYYQVVPGNLNALHSIPRYTNDLESAFEVIEVLKRKNFSFKIYTASSEYEVTIRGCKDAFASMHTDLITVSDIHPAKAICVAVCNLFEMKSKGECL